MANEEKITEQATMSTEQIDKVITQMKRDR